MAEQLENVTEGIARIEKAHPQWKVYVAAGKWFARRHGPLTDQERRTRPQSPLEAAGPDELEAAIREADPLVPAGPDELTAWST